MVKIVLMILLSLFVTQVSFSLSMTKYLPEDTILYVEADLHNLNKLFKDLTIKLYSKDHYNMLKKYMKESGKAELGFDISNPTVIRKRGFNLSKKAFLAFLPPLNPDQDLIIGVHISNKKAVESTVEKTFNKLYPRRKLKEVLKAYKSKRDRLKAILKNKQAFKKRIINYHYQGLLIKVFKRKASSYYRSSDGMREVFSYVIIDNIIFFGKKSGLTRLINSYHFKENLAQNKDLHYIFKQMGDKSRVKAYFSFKNILKLFSLEPLAKKMILSITEGVGISLDVDKEKIKLMSYARLRKRHPKYKELKNALYSKNQSIHNHFYQFPKGNFSYYTSQMNSSKMKTLIPFYEYVVPIVAQTPYLFFYGYGPMYGSRRRQRADALIYDFLGNSGSDSSIAFYIPSKGSLEVADYHPHKLNILFYSEIKKKAKAYEFIDSFLTSLMDKNSKLKEIKIKGQYFYFLSSKYLKLYGGVYKGLMLFATNKKTLNSFLNNLDRGMNKSNSSLSISSNRELRSLIGNEKDRFYQLYLDFKAVPTNIEVMDEDFNILKKVKYLYLSGKINDDVMENELYIRFK